jgi:hypothetical protein
MRVDSIRIHLGAIGRAWELEGRGWGEEARGRRSTKGVLASVAGAGVYSPSLKVYISSLDRHPLPEALGVGAPRAHWGIARQGGIEGMEVSVSVGFLRAEGGVVGGYGHKRVQRV